MNIVEVSGLRVDYDEVRAVDYVSFNLEQGKIYGFVGPNGAGKTSTMKALAGVLEPTQGEIIINGFNVETDRKKALVRVGYMPDFSPVYENLKVWEYLDVFSASHGMDFKQRPKHIEEWLEKVDLKIKKNGFVKGLSRGMRQRLVLAKILECEPNVLLLDEPASGLDPIARKQMRDLLKEASAKGTAILISSHILTELSEFVDAAIILEKGNLVVAGTIKDIRKQVGGVYKLMVHFMEEETSKVAFEKLLLSENISQDRVSRDALKYNISFQDKEDEAFYFLNKMIAHGEAGAYGVLKK